MIKCIIFDWGGVCTKSHLIKNFAHNLSGKAGLSPQKIENAFIEKDTLYELGKISSDEFWNNFSEKTGINKEAAKKEFVQTQNVREDVINYIRELKQMVILLTNNYYELLMHIRKNYPLFDKVYASCEVGIKKPDKRIFQLVLEDYNLKGEECIFVDDKKENLEPAKTLGMHTILYTNLQELEERISTLVNDNKKL
ncbi:MAG: HAD family hydrolase [Candidatus Nanoarchaeia archaeon]